MAVQHHRVKLAGSEAAPLPPDVEAGDRSERIDVTVVVKSRADDGTLFDQATRRGLQPLAERPEAPSHDDFVKRYGASPEALDLVAELARRHDLEVIETSADRCAVELTGTVEAMAEAFQAELHNAPDDDQSRWVRSGPVHLPADLAHGVQDVLGLDQRHLVTPRVAPDDRPPSEPATAIEEPRRLRYRDPRDVAELYRFPRATGQGQTVAVIGLGGGYRRSDFDAYFELRGLQPPSFRLVELLGQENQPASQELVTCCARHFGLLPPGEEAGSCEPSSYASFWATIECSMDPQLIGTLVPESSMILYLAPGTERGQYAAYSHALLAAQAPTALNISWGGCENQTPARFMGTLNRLYAMAALRDITVCASSGDFGDGSATCHEATGHFPSTSPFVMACGGCSLDRSVARQTPWSENLRGVTLSGGGGFSSVFERPPWQEGAVSGERRGFPDVASKADMLAGYDVLASGVNLPMGGTSAAAPLWAALAVRLREHLGRAPGFFAPLLYGKGFSDATFDITRDGGGSCKPKVGWDPCTGLGSPEGEALAKALG
ncbi:MAG: S53 family peptidase [Holophagales bacterium]|nr:S53 family peptidase [Holophagales bacterium]